MRDPAFGKFVLLVNGVMPLAILGWDAYYHHLGANPPEKALHTTGVLAILFLTLSLCVTPLRKISGWNGLSHFRRMLGLFAFFYGIVHLLIYLTLYVEFNPARILEYVTQNKFVIFGMTALTLMIPLAITSTNGMIKRLGALKWKWLHRLIYPAAILAMLHYYNVGKNTPPAAPFFAAALVLLLGYRLVAPWVRKSKPLPAARQSVAESCWTDLRI